MSQAKNIVVPCDRIDPPNNACKIKPAKVKKLIQSIKANGLLQPPGVIQVGDRFRIVYGNHRFQAWLQLGNQEIEVRVLPADTNELSISLQENHVREPEDFEDTLARVEKRAKQLGCSLKRAAELENVKPAYISRAKKIVKNLDDAVIRLSKEKGVGFSVLYQISGVEGKRQMELLSAYLDGSMNREAIAKAVKQKSKPTVKLLTLSANTGKAIFNLTLPATTTYEQILQELSALKKLLTTHHKNGIPVKLLPEVLKGGQANVVLSS